MASNSSSAAFFDVDPFRFSLHRNSSMIRPAVLTLYESMGPVADEPACSTLARTNNWLTGLNIAFRCFQMHLKWDQAVLFLALPNLQVHFSELKQLLLPAA
eukprot:8992360-Lingulodinium_polyedra.AAC.1